MRIAIAGFCSFLAIAAAFAEPPSVAVAAEGALQEGGRLATAMDALRLAGEHPASLEEGLALIREPMPAKTLGVESWSAQSGSIHAAISSPRLCREIQDRCAGLSANAPWGCSCLPRRGGAFHFITQITTWSWGERLE